MLRVRKPRPAGETTPRRWRALPTVLQRQPTYGVLALWSHPCAQRSSRGRRTTLRALRAPKRACGGCGRVDHVTAIVDGQDLCQRCHFAPVRACGQCGQERRVATRLQNGVADLCHSCYRTPIAERAIYGRSARFARPGPSEFYMRRVLSTRAPPPRRLRVLWAG